MGRRTPTASAKALDNNKNTNKSRNEESGGRASQRLQAATPDPQSIAKTNGAAGNTTNARRKPLPFTSANEGK